MTQELTDFAKGFVQGCHNKGMTFEDMQKSADYASQLIPGVREELDCLKGADMEKISRIKFNPLRLLPKIPKWVPKWMRPKDLAGGLAETSAETAARTAARGTALPRWPQTSALTPALETAETAAQTSGDFLPKLTNLFKNPSLGQSGRSAANRGRMAQILQKIPGARSPAATAGYRAGGGYLGGGFADWGISEGAELVAGPADENSGWMRNLLADPGLRKILPWATMLGGLRTGKAQTLSTSPWSRIPRAIYDNRLIKSRLAQGMMASVPVVAEIGNRQTQGQRDLTDMVSAMGQVATEDNTELAENNAELLAQIQGLTGGASASPEETLALNLATPTDDAVADPAVAPALPPVDDIDVVVPEGPLPANMKIEPGINEGITPREDQSPEGSEDKPLPANQRAGVQTDEERLQEEAATKKQDDAITEFLDEDAPQPGIGEGIGRWWKALSPKQQVGTVLGVLGVLGGPAMMSRGHGGMGLGSTALGGLLLADMMGIFGEPGHYTNMLMKQFGFGDTEKKEDTGSDVLVGSIEDTTKAPSDAGSFSDVSGMVAGTAAGTAATPSAAPSAASATGAAPAAAATTPGSSQQALLKGIANKHPFVGQFAGHGGDRNVFDSREDVIALLTGYVTNDITDKQMYSLVNSIRDPAERKSLAAQIVEGLRSSNSARAKSKFKPIVNALMHGTRM